MTALYAWQASCTVLMYAEQSDRSNAYHVDINSDCQAQFTDSLATLKSVIARFEGTEYVGFRHLKILGTCKKAGQEFNVVRHQSAGLKVQLNGNIPASLGCVAFFDSTCRQLSE